MCLGIRRAASAYKINKIQTKIGSKKNIEGDKRQWLY